MSTTHTAKSTNALPKIKAHELEPGMTVRFTTSQTRPSIHETYNEEYGFWRGPLMESNVDYEIAGVELGESYRGGNTGRRVRQYLVTLADGRQFEASSSQGFRVASR